MRPSQQFQISKASIYPKSRSRWGPAKFALRDVAGREDTQGLFAGHLAAPPHARETPSARYYRAGIRACLIASNSQERANVQ